MTRPEPHGISRRSVLRGAAIAGAAASLPQILIPTRAHAVDDDTSGSYVIAFNDNGAKRQMILGLGFEIQSDSVGSNDGPTDDTLVSGVPLDLTATAYTRFINDMLKAGRTDRSFRYCRLAMGLYHRGIGSRRRHPRPCHCGRLRDGGASSRLGRRLTSLALPLPVVAHGHLGAAAGTAVQPSPIAGAVEEAEMAWGVPARLDAPPVAALGKGRHRSQYGSEHTLHPRLRRHQLDTTGRNHRRQRVERTRAPQVPLGTLQRLTQALLVAGVREQHGHQGIAQLARGRGISIGRHGFTAELVVLRQPRRERVPIPEQLAPTGPVRARVHEREHGLHRRRDGARAEFGRSGCRTAHALTLHQQEEALTRLTGNPERHPT